MTAISLYDITVPQLITSLEALSGILTKASDTASSKGLDASTFPEARLAADMRPLIFQVQTACNTAKFIPVRTAGMANVEQADDETTMEQLQARIASTVDMLKGAKREAFEGKQDEVLEVRGIKYTGLGYVMRFALPNFFFHVTMAYAILRNQGIDVGKLDFLGNIKGAADADGIIH